ncbi:MAG: hypothetical protein GC161_00395 [Planctomycetaceae bacterium]|nr:hypothetical protein [Planctomycetaceae bacterium]
MLTVASLPGGVVCVAPAPFERARAALVAADLLDRLVRRGEDSGAPIEAAEMGPVWLKGGPLLRHAPLRHGLAWRALRRLPPRLREAFRLHELGRAGLPAAKPLFAVARFVGPRCAVQGLALAHELGATPLARALREAAPADRATLLAQCAELLARLHDGGFEHGDLYLRNVLVVERGGPPQPILIDRWRGGRRASGPLHHRARARDLGQWFLEGALCLDRGEQREFLGLYGERAGGALPAAARWSATLARARQRELRRALGDPRRGLRPEKVALHPGEFDPEPTWSPPIGG